MQKTKIINFFETWKSLLYPLCDIEYQRKNWFRQEGSEISSFEEATGYLIERYIDHMNMPECQPFYQKEFGILMKQLYEKVNEYTKNSESLINSVDEKRLLNDPKWLSIVALAKKIFEILDRSILEVQDVQR